MSDKFAASSSDEEIDRISSPKTALANAQLTFAPGVAEGDNQPQRKTSNRSNRSNRSSRSNKQAGVSVHVDSKKVSVSAGGAAVDVSFNANKPSGNEGEPVTSSAAEFLSQESLVATEDEAAKDKAVAVSSVHGSPAHIDHQSTGGSIRYSVIETVTTNNIEPMHSNPPLPSTSVYSLQGNYSQAGESAYGSTQQTLASSEPSTAATLYKPGFGMQAHSPTATHSDLQSTIGVAGGDFSVSLPHAVSTSVSISEAFQTTSTEDHPKPAMLLYGTAAHHGDGAETPSRFHHPQVNAATAFQSAHHVYHGERSTSTLAAGEVPIHQHRASPQSLFHLAANYASNHRSPMDSTHKSSVSGTPYEESSRRVSCVVISEEYLVAPPQTTSVRYVEVPMIEETSKRIPRREIRENTQYVPKYEVEYVERDVQTPCIQYIEKKVEMPVYQDVIVTSPSKHKQIVEVPREIIKTVPKVETILVEKIVNVPGEVIEVPKMYQVNRDVSKRVYADRETPVVVAQTVRQTVTETAEVRELVTYAYEPEIIHFDVPVLKFVQTLAAEPSQSHVHQRVSIPSAHYNSLLKSLNTHLHEEDLPYLRDGNQMFILTQHEAPGFCYPVADFSIAGGVLPRLSEELLQDRRLSVSTMKSAPISLRQQKAARHNANGSSSSRTSLGSRSSYNQGGQSGHATRSSHKISMRGSTTAMSANMMISNSARRASQPVHHVSGGSVRSACLRQQRTIAGEMVSPHTLKSVLSKGESTGTGTARKTKLMTKAGSPKRCSRCCVCVA